MKINRRLTQSNTFLSVRSKDSAGFSLLELILYLALFSIVIISVVTIAARSVSSRTKSRAVQNVEYSARYVVERMTSDIRSAVDINEADFSSNVLTLTMSDGEIVTYQESGDAMTLQRNSNSAIGLTPTNIQVDTFSLIDRSPVGTEITDVDITMAVSTSAPAARQEYDASFTLTSGARMRMNP